MADNRPTVYNEGDNWIYRASGSGSCVKYLVAAALGYEDQRGKKTDDLLERSANEGNLHEEAVVKKLEEEGIKVVEQQDEINVQVIPGVFLRGHKEGLLVYPDDSKQLFEVKSMSTKQFTKWQNHGFNQFERYAYQISTYMQAHPELDVRYICKRREDGYTVEKIIPAGEPPVPFALIRKKVILAEKYRRKSELPKCDIANQWGCPVWYLHDEEEDEDFEPLTEEMQEILGELALQFVDLKTVEKKGTDSADIRKKKLSPEILNLLGNLDQTEVTYQGRKFRVTRRKSGRSYLDKEKVIAIIGEDRLDEVMSTTKFQFPIVNELDF